MTIAMERIWRTPLQALAYRILPLLWRARLGWLRITLAGVFGAHTYVLVKSWHADLPAMLYHGWFLDLVPAGVRDMLLQYPNRVAAVVVVLTVLSVIGLGTRPALFALVLVGLFARSIETSQGVFDHESSLTTQVLFVLVFIPGTNSLSAEHLIRWWRAGRRDLWRHLAGTYRRWGEYLVLGLLAITYTASGLSKLRFGGVSWLNGDTLGFYLRGLTAGDQVYNVGGGPATWRDDFGLEMYTYGNYAFGQYPSATFAAAVDWLAHTPALLAVISTATVLLEVCGLLLFIPRLRSIMLIAYMGMHTTIGLLMGLPFLQYQLICFLFIEWELVAAFLAVRLARRNAPPTIEADGTMSPVGGPAREHQRG